MVNSCTRVIECYLMLSNIIFDFFRNLTDESPTTCSVFLEEGGMELFIDVLDTFPGDNCIETKVLGLLNNIAEVAHLRPHLMVDHFLTNLRYCF